MAISREQLRKDILRVFPDFPPLEDYEIPWDAAIDPHEREAVVRVFGGKRWRDYSDEPLKLLGPESGYSLNIYFMSPEAFRSFLPLFLLEAFVNHDPESQLYMGVMQKLILGRDPVEKEYHAEVFSSVSPEQIRVIEDCLRFVGDASEGEIGPYSVKEALESLEPYR